MFKPRMMTLTGMILMAALSRLIPHPPNFSPITAMALFGGAHFSKKSRAFLIPLAAMLLSDMFLGFHRLVPVVYGCFALTVCLGMWCRKRQGMVSLTYATLTSSVLFFAITNFSVWAFTPLYPKTFAGLVTCFIAAIPFFGNTLLGNAIYTGIMFVTFATAAKRIPSLNCTHHTSSLPYTTPMVVIPAGCKRESSSSKLRKFIALVLVAAILSSFQTMAQATTDNPDAVFISLTRIAEPKNELPTNIAVITSDEIKRSGAQNVNEAIERNTAIQILPYGTLGSAASLRIRGFSSSQVLVMVDERPVSDLVFGAPNLSQIPVDNIERIEVVRGGASASYGANAMGGVINIITKKASANNPVTDITAESSGFNTRIYRLNFGRTKSLAGGSELETFVTGSRNLSNGFRQNSRYDSDAFSCQFGYKTDAMGKISVELQNVNSRLGIPGMLFGLSSDKFDGSRERVATTPQAKQEGKKFASRLEYETSHDYGTTKFRVHFSNSDDKSHDPDIYAYDTLNVARAIGLEVLGNYTENWVAGAAYNRDRLDWRDRIDISKSFVASAGNWAIFGENKHKITAGIGEFKIISGLRFDRQTQFGGTLSPRLSTVYQPEGADNGWKFSANIGRSYRAPTLSALFVVDPTFTGNPNLKPEVAYTYDIGVSKDWAAGHTVAATIFRADLKDIITNVEVNPGIYAGVNLDRGFKQGLELEAAGTITRHIRHNANYTYLVNKAQIGSSSEYKTISYSPKHFFNYFMEAKIPYGLRLGSDLKYVNKRFSRDGENGERLASYTLWDMKVSRQVLGANVFLGVHNLLNKRYVNLAGWPQPGRYYSAGISIRFMG